AQSKGRDYPEKESDYRTAFQRDIDRIVHSKAFRRLEYKTQVFVNYEGDHYRTRLTHTFEVAQVAEAIAKSLNLNIDLTKAIALAHDLGHTPFGHAGEEILNRLTQDVGGFEHNRQSLRVVEMLETRYPDFTGLNLTWEVREGLLKHSSIYDHPCIDRFNADKYPTLETQVVNLADELAYLCHDLDDGIRAKIININDFRNTSLGMKVMASYLNEDLLDDLLRYQTVRSLKNMLVLDALIESDRRLRSSGVESYDDVANYSELLIGFSTETKNLTKELSDFLLEMFYLNHRIVRMTTKAKWFLEDLFHRYSQTQRLLPEKIQTLIKQSNEPAKRIICDYIAGMTDRFALEEYRKLVDPNTLV
ncbi:deoxyguanosinetriphosphate triphosphohydrolase, partial [bacterium]|nr:deoxyguanosinetriphosphate triphosphohydrolase [candidate division CSSED10-310 bacterium]